MFKEYKYIYLFDTETTGLSSVNNEIIELGGILMENDGTGKFNTIEEMDYFVKNDAPIPDFIKKLTHIDDDMCKKGLTKEQFINKLKVIFNNSNETLVIAYNTPFDISFIKETFNKFNPNWTFNNDTLDLLEIAKERTGLRKGNKLCDMLNRYNIIEFENSHRAIDDVKATLEVMRAMYLEKNDIESYIRKGIN